MQGKGLKACQRSTTSSEFSLWQAFFYWQDRVEVTKTDLYLARIAFEVYRAARPETKLTIEDFVLTFHPKKKEKAQEQNLEEQRKLARINKIHRLAWLGLTEE